MNTLFLPLFLPLFFPLFFSQSLADDKITTSTPLSGKNTIVSSGGIFELGFFSPGKSSKHYIGIWYKKVSIQTIVWVANRASPVSDPQTSSLQILNGNLALVSSKTLIWSTNLTNPNPNPNPKNPPEAILTDTGNLILRQPDPKNPTHFQTLWQSFDHPGNTWLPGGKISFNKTSKTGQHLTSWKNVDDPAPGLFSMELDPVGRQYIIKWNGSNQYWTSGSWDPAQQIFDLVPEMRLNYIYNFSYVDNVNESYFTYSVYENKMISRFVMDVSGQIKMLSWLENSQQWNLFWSQPRQQCQVYAYCGNLGVCTQNSLPYCECLDGFDPVSEADWGLNDYSGGCVRKKLLQCENPRVKGNPRKKDRDRFRVVSDMGFDDKNSSAARRVGNVIGLEECKDVCLGNCSCVAVSYDRGVCSVWSGELLNLQQLSDGDSSGRMFYVRLAASEFPSGSHGKLIVGVVVGCFGVICALLGAVFIVFWRRRRRQKMRAVKSVQGSLESFTYRELQSATKNFSEKLGGGGFGSVFKGTLPDSSLVAVKKLESFSQGEKQFRTEVSTIGTVQHYNLVRLRGFCSEGSSRKLLVYDYMPNGSLDSHLFHHEENPKNRVLGWKARYQVALGTARGLAYLHEKCRDCIIHCDIKPENILLDSELVPKVADFGLAKLVGRDFSRVLTTMRGTRGYLAPEWISGLPITAKADVFSYGMTLFELVSGRRNTEQSEDGRVTFFPTIVANKVSHDEDNIMSLLDPKLDPNDVEKEQVLKVCKLACWCVQDDEFNRPSMGQVVQILEGVLDVNNPPMPRSLQVFEENQEDVMFFTESSTSQTRANSGVSSKTKSSSTSNSMTA